MLIDLYAGENNGVEGKRECTYTEMQGYLDAKSRHNKYSLNITTEII